MSCKEISQTRDGSKLQALNKRSLRSSSRSWGLAYSTPFRSSKTLQTMRRLGGKRRPQATRSRSATLLMELAKASTPK
jgi:hypothetical protein